MVRLYDIEVKNPYAVVLLPEYTIVRVGEKEDMMRYYEKVLDRIHNFTPTPESKRLVEMVSMMFKDLGVEDFTPTKDDLLKLAEDYRLVELPKHQETFDKIMSITGYLKRFYEQSVVLN